MKTYQQKGNTALLMLNHKTSKKVFINEVVLLKGLQVPYWGITQISGKFALLLDIQCKKWLTN